MFSVVFVCLSAFLTVCLSVNNITQKVTNGLRLNYKEGFGVVKKNR